MQLPLPDISCVESFTYHLPNCNVGICNTEKIPYSARWI